MRTLQKPPVAVHASVHNHFNQSTIYNRSNFELVCPPHEWRGLACSNAQLLENETFALFDNSTLSQ
jgi:hypothetical protein